MSKAAGDILQEFYLRLRKGSTSADGTPITARQLESLARLAEARARVHLRDEVTAEDAKVNNVEYLRLRVLQKSFRSGWWACPISPTMHLL